MVSQKSAIYDQPWVEKYRPQCLEEIASQTLTIQSLQQFVKTKSIPHMIFAGPAGTGKTSAARSLINDVIGKENVSQDLILERNASDDVRMSTRDEIKNFVRHTGIGQQNQFKFVIMDEADNISREMQSAFRRIIEMAPSNVKFIFMCNFVEQIIDPIISRCAIFRFYPLPKKHFDKKMKEIAESEQIPINDAVLEALFFISQGDLRKAINLFQTIVALYQENQDNQKISIDPSVIYHISGFLTPRQLEEVFTKISSKKFDESREVVKKLRGITSRGLFRQIMLKMIHEKITFPKLEKILINLAEADYRLTLEADQTIQIDGLLASLINLVEAE